MTQNIFVVSGNVPIKCQKCEGKFSLFFNLSIIKHLLLAYEILANNKSGKEKSVICYKHIEYRLYIFISSGVVNGVVLCNTSGSLQFQIKNSADKHQSNTLKMCDNRNSFQYCNITFCGIL